MKEMTFSGIKTAAEFFSGRCRSRMVYTDLTDRIFRVGADLVDRQVGTAEFFIITEPEADDFDNDCID